MPQRCIAHLTGAMCNHCLPQSLANLLWGYCKLDVYPEELFKAAAAELVER